MSGDNDRRPFDPEAAAKGRRARAEHTINIMAATIFAGIEGMSHEEVLREACKIYRRSREDRGRIFDEEGLDLYSFGKPRAARSY